MTRLARTPETDLQTLEARVRALERRNPLESASTEGTVQFNGSAALILSGSAALAAGNYRVDSSGFFLPWQGESRSVNSLMSSINAIANGAVADAAAAQSRADTGVARANLALNALPQIRADISANATAASNAHSRANDAYSRASSALSQANSNFDTILSIVQALTQTIAAMEVRPGYSRPTPPNMNG